MKLSRIMLLLGLLCLPADNTFAANPFKKFAENLQKIGENMGQRDFNGMWEGYAAIPGAPPYPIVITLNGDDNRSWAYPSVGCFGTLHPTHNEKSARVFQLKVTQGTCQPGSKLLLTSQSKTQLKFEWFDASGNIGLSAILSRGSTFASNGMLSQGGTVANLNGMALASNPQAVTGTTPQGDAKSQAEALLRAQFNASKAQIAQLEAYDPKSAKTALAQLEAAEAQALVQIQSLTQEQAQAYVQMMNQMNARIQAAQSMAAGAQPGQMMIPTYVATAPQPIGEMKFSAVVTRNANMRTGPTTTDDIVVTIPEGNMVTISPKQGDWYQAHAVIEGESLIGWIFHSLISTQMVEVIYVEPPPQAGQTNISYAGYSEQFLGIRTMFVGGELNKIEEVYSEQEAETLAKMKRKKNIEARIGLLRWLERGTLALDQGLYETSLDHFSTSELLIENYQGRSIIGGGASKLFGGIGELFSGNQELQPYRSNGWEMVLMLNYKSISYLLQGDRRAYNVARRAIDWQNIEKKAFDKALAEEEAKLDQKNQKELAKLKKKEEKNRKREEKQKAKMAESLSEEELLALQAQEEANPQIVLQPPGTAIREIYTRMLEPMDKKASSVASAYVNPFGFYVSGMIQEFESYNDSSLLDNARISYSKALELNPNSKVLEEAVKDMKSGDSHGNSNLVHFIVADGFVPEKKVLTYYMASTSALLIPLKLPVYEPVISTVDRIEVQSVKGKRLGTLSVIADLEAICLRQQKDRQKIQVLRALTSYFVNAFMIAQAANDTKLTGKVIGLFGALRSKSAAPDTRSWMSLPATIQATRIHIKKGVKKVKLVSFNKSGKRLASRFVDLIPDSHGIVYARTANNIMYPQTANGLWM